MIDFVCVDQATFRMMPSSQRCGQQDPEVVRADSPFCLKDEVCIKVNKKFHCYTCKRSSLQNDQLLFEDLVHYMYFAMGIYGSALHLFDNMLCGLCQLGSKTWYPNN